MKRLIICVLIVICAGVFCFGRSRSSRQPLLKIIQLAEPKFKGTVSFEEALVRRRSVRQYADRPLGFGEISQLAWAGQGITEPEKGLRTAPSAGALYPIDLYFATPEGLFLYRPGDHILEQTLTNDVRGVLGPAPCDIVLAGSVRKTAIKFRDKGKTYMLLEAGHIAQNIQLQAVCMGLGSVTIGGINTREVARVCRLPKGAEAIYVISVGYPAAATTARDREQDSIEQMLIGKGKRAVFIIPSNEFRDDELVETKRALGLAGVETFVASTKRGMIKGMLGNVVEAEVMLNSLKADDYDAIIFIGGPGVAEYFDSPIAHSIARAAVEKGKILAAISAAPTILGNAGVLVGKRVTGFVSERERLQQAGAIYTGAPVERQALIITCTGPVAVKLFARAIVDALSGR